MTELPRFSTGEIRRMMDVFTADNVHLGSVLWIRAEKARARAPELDSSVRVSSEIDGESLGVFPTQRAGNTGPIRQSAAQRYATDPAVDTALRDGELIVGKYYGLGGIRRISFDDIQTVALERIVLRKTHDELD